MRKANINRKTGETNITLSLNLDGSGSYSIDTGIGFLDHMLELFARHGRFDIELSCTGDIHVDDHHSTEDIGICLGKAFNEALGDKRGIYRYADVIIPMDEALILAAADISGRPYLGFGLEIPAEKVGTFDTELVSEFWTAFVNNAGISLHLKMLAGQNSHHIIEGAFKAAARALSKAAAINKEAAEDIPSTKGIL